MRGSLQQFEIFIPNDARVGHQPVLGNWLHQTLASWIDSGLLLPSPIKTLRGLLKPFFPAQQPADFVAKV
ncbi:hypothetical protein ON05_022955 [Acaryochloris sp. CCMEE 5410]|nr:hypothetical protein ON05_022955 [Acaryochloris sp. CCMEE 5410]